MTSANVQPGRQVAKACCRRIYAASSDPQRLIRVFIHEEMTGILVAGDPGRNQSRGYMGNHDQGVPVSKRVTLQRNWSQLVEKSGK
jgi:hypothetical protein